MNLWRIRSTKRRPLPLGDCAALSDCAASFQRTTSSTGRPLSEQIWSGWGG